MKDTIAPIAAIMVGAMLIVWAADIVIDCGRENARLTAQLEIANAEIARLKLPPADSQCLTWLFDTNLKAARDRICKPLKP